MALAYARTPSALMWLRVNVLINGLYKQISCKTCLYTNNLYFMLVNKMGGIGWHSVRMEEHHRNQPTKTKLHS